MKTRRELERELKRLQARAAREGAPRRPRRNPAYEPSSDALRELVGLLDRREDTFAWMIANAPDGSLRGAWMASDDPVSMVSLYGRTGDRAGLARAAVAATRQAVSFALPGDSPTHAFVATADGWTRGTASLAQVRQAFVESEAMVRRGSRYETAERWEVFSDAFSAVRAMLATILFSSFAEEARSAVFWSLTALGSDPDQYASALVTVAYAVRRVLPVPTLAQVLR